MDWTSTKKKKNDKSSSTKAIVADIDLADNEDDVLNFNAMELIQNKSEKKKEENKVKTEPVLNTTKSKSEPKKPTTKKPKTITPSRQVISLDDDDDLIEDIDKTPTKKQKTIAKTLDTKKLVPPPPST